MNKLVSWDYEMPVKPPNFTQIPNEILDKMHEMTPAEFKVLVAICRKTFGWHKDRDVISLSQLEQMTGLSRTAVQSGIVAGINRRMLARTKVAKQSYSYQLVVSDYQSTETTSSLSGTDPVASDYQQLVASDYTQKKELNKKENDDDVTQRLKAMTFSATQINVIVTAAAARHGFTLDDCDLCERWLDAQRPEWTGKYGALYKTLKVGELPVLPRTPGPAKAAPQPTLTMADVERRTAEMIANDPDAAALLEEIRASGW